MKATKVPIQKPEKAMDKLLPVIQTLIPHCLKSGPVVIYTCKVSGDFEITFVSENVKKQFGYEPNDFISDSSFRASRIHPDDFSRVMNGLKSLLENDSHTHEYRFLHHDGTYRWVRDELIVIQDAEGNPIESVGTWLDITESIENKASLLKQQEELQIIFDSVPAGIFYTDLENRFIRVNKAFAYTMKMAKEELEGKFLFDIYPKEQAEVFWKDDLDVITSNLPKSNIIEPITTEEGTLWLQTNKIPYRDALGNCKGIIGFTLDITEPKKAEEELINYRNHLEEEVKELNSGDLYGSGHKK